MNPATKPYAVSGLLVRQNTATGTIALVVFLAAGVFLARRAAAEHAQAQR